MDKLIKTGKGLLYAVGFIGFAVSIMTEPYVDVQGQIALHGINPRIFAGLFALAGIAAFLYGVKNWRWNGLIFAPYFSFTAFAIDATVNKPELSGSTITVYMLLGALLFIDYIVDAGLLKGLMYRGRNTD